MDGEMAVGRGNIVQGPKQRLQFQLAGRRVFESFHYNGGNRRHGGELAGWRRDVSAETDTGSGIQTAVGEQGPWGHGLNEVSTGLGFEKCGMGGKSERGRFDVFYQARNRPGLIGCRA